jgi:hypothetical protein
VEVSDRLLADEGMADMDAHPYCYLQLDSANVFNFYTSNPRISPSINIHTLTDKDCSRGIKEAAKDGISSNEREESITIGEIFSHSVEKGNSGRAYKKSIIPTSKIFHVALHLHGACHLAQSWTDCNAGGDLELASHQSNQFCYTHNKLRIKSTLAFRKKQRGYTVHAINEKVTAADAYQLNAQTDAVIYHFRLFAPFLVAPHSTALRGNEYASKWFPKVFNELVCRGFKEKKT